MVATHGGRAFVIIILFPIGKLWGYDTAPAYYCISIQILF